VKVFVNCGSTMVRAIACITPRMVRRLSSSCVVAISAPNQRRLNELMRTGKTTRIASPSRPFRAAEHLRSDAEVAAYIEAMLEDGDARVVPIALRTVADAVGGMAALARKTGLSRETLYRTLSKRGNPRLDTLAVILAAFGLRLTVRARSVRPLRGRAALAHA
jgi:probable addiction module antidote protein